ncbi:MAG: Gfo/Idh/MocA family oxidoreductase [Armatimonadota bacterium]
MAFNKDNEAVSRRSVLTGGATAAGSLIAASAAAQAKKPAAPKPTPKPQAKPAAPKPAGPPAIPINVGIIGFGPQGRELAAAISRVPGATVLGVADTYKPTHRRVAEAAPKATAVEDYRQLLERKDVPAVFIATPTHLHKEIVLAALQAGKHVYLESPMAHTLEDGKEIALAGKNAKTHLQIGQQFRGNPQHHHVARFMKMSAIGRPVMGRGQWSRRIQWSRPGSDEMNWRLNPELSLGLIGEIGIHSLDVANWFLSQRPVAVSGYGVKMREDGDTRDIPDTVQCVLEYGDGTRFTFTSTLANSYEGEYQLFHGTQGAVLVRDDRAWMFKEADSPLLGWEVYARKEDYGAETGIALVADASKQLKEGKMPGKEKQEKDPGKAPLVQSVKEFLDILRGTAEEVVSGKVTKIETPRCGPEEGYQALVTALKANEAVMTGSRIKFQKEWFSL